MTTIDGTSTTDASPLERRRRPRVARLPVRSPTRWSRLGADVDRLVGALRRTRHPGGHAPTGRPTPTVRPPTRRSRELNRVTEATSLLHVYVYATVATDSRDEQAQAIYSEIARPTLRCGRSPPGSPTGCAALGVDELADAQRARSASTSARCDGSRLAPNTRCPKPEEDLYAELQPPARRRGGACRPTSRRSSPRRSRFPDGAQTLPMPAVRGLATDPDPAVRRAAYDAEMAAWPTIAVPVAAAMNAIKGEANVRQPSPRLAVAARRVAVRQQRQPADVRRDAVGGHRVAARLPPVDAG